MRKINLYKGVTEKRIIGAILLLSLLIRTMWLLVFDPEIASDAHWYFEKAGMLASAEGYFSEGRLTAFYPIGYPAFLSAFFYVFGQSILIGRLANLFLSVFSVWMFYLLSKQFSMNSLFRVIAVFLFALYPNHIAYTSLLYNETLFTTLFLAALYFQLQFFRNQNNWYLLFSALIYGLGVLTRPAAFFVPVLVFAAIYFYNRKSGLPVKYEFRLWKPGFFYVIILLVLLPWQIRNYKAFESFVFVSTTGGFDLLIGNHPGATGNYNPDIEYFSQIDRSGGELDYDKKTKKLAINYIKKNPLKVFQRLPRKACYFLWPGMDGMGWNKRGISGSKLTFLNRLQYIGNGFYLLLLGLLGMSVIHNMVNMKKTNALFWVTILICAYYLLVSLVFFGESRFHFHLIPLAILLIAEWMEGMLKLNHE